MRALRDAGQEARGRVRTAAHVVNVFINDGGLLLGVGLPRPRFVVAAGGGPRVQVPADGAGARRVHAVVSAASAAGWAGPFIAGGPDRVPPPGAGAPRGRVASRPPPAPVEPEAAVPPGAGAAIGPAAGPGRLVGSNGGVIRRRRSDVNDGADGATAAAEGVENGAELPGGGLPGGGRHRRAGGGGPGARERAAAGAPPRGARGGRRRGGGGGGPGPGRAPRGVRGGICCFSVLRRPRPVALVVVVVTCGGGEVAVGADQIRVGGWVRVRDVTRAADLDGISGPVRMRRLQGRSRPCPAAAAGCGSAPPLFVCRWGQMAADSLCNGRDGNVAAMPATPPSLGMRACKLGVCPPVRSPVPVPGACTYVRTPPRNFVSSFRKLGVKAWSSRIYWPICSTVYIIYFYIYFYF